MISTVVRLTVKSVIHMVKLWDKVIFPRIKSMGLYFVRRVRLRIYYYYVT